MDRLKITLHPPLNELERGPWKRREARIAINNVPLLELVRRAEEPRARAEYLE